jgi:membrane protease YdiL (CAAX protease family)
MSTVMTDILASAVGTQRSAPQANMWRRILVFLEVTLVTLLIPMTRLGFKYLIPVGALHTIILQMGVGVVIMAPAVCLFLILRRTDFKAYGITLHGWPGNLKIGVLLSLLCVVEIIVSRRLFRFAGVAHYSGYETRGNLIALCFALPSLALFALILRYTQFIAKYVQIGLAWVIFVGLWAMPLVLVVYFYQPLGPAILTFVRLVFIAGFGEEFIFRGYIQPRLNEVLGRPFCVGGIQFGWGLFLAAFLFGLVHVFNGVDPIHGRIQLQWTWGMATCVTGIIGGCLREKTGNILSGAILHGNNDIWVLIVQNLKF